MLSRTISPDILNAISSPESEDGVTLSDLRDGPILATYGLSVVPANLSARRAKAAGLLMSGIYGPSPIGLLHNGDLSQSLANRLQVRMGSTGSTLFRLIWKTRLTPAGRSIYVLRASGRRTSGKDCTSVPTPCVAVPTPRGPHGAGPSDGVTRGFTPEGTAQLATVPTPNARDHHAQGPRENSESHVQVNLCDVVKKLATPNCPRAHDNDNSAGRWYQSKNQDSLDSIPLLVDGGVIAIGGTGKTKIIGQLNPDYSRWLMGFPAAWGSCADMAMLLSRNSRRSSSKQAKR